MLHLENPESTPHQEPVANKVLHEFPSNQVVVLVVTTLSVYVYNII